MSKQAAKEQSELRRTVEASGQGHYLGTAHQHQLGGPEGTNPFHSQQDVRTALNNAQIARAMKAHDPTKSSEAMSIVVGAGDARSVQAGRPLSVSVLYFPDGAPVGAYETLTLPSNPSAQQVVDAISTQFPGVDFRYYTGDTGNRMLTRVLPAGARP